MRWLVVLAVAFLAHNRPAAGQAQPAAQAGSDPVIVFTWASSSAPDQAVRDALFPLVASAVRKAGGVHIDVSPARPAEPDTRETLRKAVSAYDAMRMDESLALLDEVVEQITATGARGLDRDRLIDAFVYRGLARSELGDDAGAWADFVRAAVLDPTRELDPARFRPSAVKTYGRAREEARKRGTVELTVKASAGSSIHIDGRTASVGSATESVIPGEHYVWVDRAEGRPFGQTITVSQARTLEVPAQSVQPPSGVDLSRRAARFGAGPPLLIALAHDNGARHIEISSIRADGTSLLDVVRLGPSPVADGQDVARAITSAMATVTRPAEPPVPLVETRVITEKVPWYKNHWLWLGVGAASTLLIVTPFLLDAGDDMPPIGATLDPGPLQ